MIKSVSGLRALNNMVLIEPLNNETVTKSGIIIPEKVQRRKPRKGLIRKVSSDSPVTEGEIVLYPAGHGTEVVLKEDDGTDKTFEIVRDADLMLVI